MLVAHVAPEVGIDPDLLAAVAKWESRSLTNGTGSEYLDNAADGVKRIIKSDVSVGLMQMQPQAVGRALDETPEIAAWFAESVFLTPPAAGSKAMVEGLYDASATNKSLSMHLGGSFLRIMERETRAGLRDRGVAVGSSAPAGAAVVYLSSLVATAYTTTPEDAVVGFSNGSVSWASVNPEFYTYGLTATSRVLKIADVGARDR